MMRTLLLLALLVIFAKLQGQNAVPKMDKQIDNSHRLFTSFLVGNLQNSTSLTHQNDHVDLVPETEFGKNLCDDFKPFVNSMLILKWQNRTNAWVGFSVEVTYDQKIGVGFGLLLGKKTRS